jgi:hypothetical protein
MPYEVGNGPPILDVFDSLPNVYINNVRVALWLEAGTSETATPNPTNPIAPLQDPSSGS